MTNGHGFWSEDFTSRKAAEDRAEKARAAGGLTVSVHQFDDHWTVCYQSPEDDYSDLDECATKRVDSRRDAGETDDGVVARKDHPSKIVYGD